MREGKGRDGAAEAMNVEVTLEIEDGQIGGWAGEMRSWWLMRWRRCFKTLHYTYALCPDDHKKQKDALHVRLLLLLQLPKRHSEIYELTMSLIKKLQHFYGQKTFFWLAGRCQNKTLLTGVHKATGIHSKACYSCGLLTVSQTLTIKTDLMQG